MSSYNQFPPSSPLAASIHDNHIEKNTTPLLPLNFKNSNHTIYNDTKHQKGLISPYKNTTRNEYPTPFPSSSTGQVSSPIKERHENVYDNSSSYYHMDLNSSFNGASYNDEEEEEEEERDTTNNHIIAFTKPIIKIEINPMDDSTFTIGRQSKSCNIILPKLKLISRKHAVLKYSPLTNKISLQCLGTNGLIVSLPRRLGCHLVKRDADSKIYELSSNLINNYKVKPIEKKLLKEANLTSFVLLMGETVMMPFMNNTIIDFRDAETFLSMKQLPSFTDETSDNEMSATQQQQQKEEVKTQLSIHNTSTSKRLLNSSIEIKKPIKKARIIKPKRSTDEIINDLNHRNIDCMDIQHVLANYLAYANVQQTPLSQLMVANSRTKSLSKEELRALLANESCIGVIYRQGKDAAGKPLEEEYYYDIENDSNDERKMMVQSIKGGRTGLRSCRRTHKQYFWKKPAKK